MFLKLLKQDIKSTLRVWWLMLPIVPAITAVGAISLRIVTTVFFQAEVDIPAFAILSAIIAYFVFLATFIGLSVVPLVTEVLVFFRFYKNLFTDEGYLTFTLPAKRSTILRAKTVNSYLWIAIGTVMTVVGYMVIFILGMPTAWGEFPINLEIFEGTFFLIKDLFTTLGVWTVVYAVELLAIVLVSLFFSVSLIQFCLTLGAMMVKRAKLLVGIVIYWLVNQTLSFVFQFFFWLIGLSTGTTFAVAWEAIGQQATLALIAVFLMILGIAMTIFALSLYFITRNCLERRLNLA